jgi:hypothetical protein
MTIPQQACGSKGHVASQSFSFSEHHYSLPAMAEATDCSCSQSGFLGLCFRSDDLSSTQVGLVLLAATIGIVTFLALLYRVTRVLLSLFILPGRSVCPSLHMPYQGLSRLTPSTASELRPSRLLGPHNWRQRWHWQRIRRPACKSRLQPHPCIANSL